MHDRASKVLEANRRAMEELRRAQQEQPVELSDSESSGMHCQYGAEHDQQVTEDPAG